MERALPKNWLKTTLGEVLELSYGKSLPKKSRIGDKYPVLGSNGVVDFHESYLVKGPGIVVGRKGSHGEINWVEDNFYPIDTTYFVDSYAPSNLSFIYRLLQSIDLKSLNRSTAIPGLNRNDAYDCKIYLPPLPEQQRIVAKLDRLFGHLEQVKTRLEKIPTLLKNFRQAILTQAVTGKLTEEWRVGKELGSIFDISDSLIKERKEYYLKELAESKKRGLKKPRKPGNLDFKVVPDLEKDTWGSLKFSELSSVVNYSMTSGPFGSALGKKDYVSEGVPVLRGQNIKQGYFNANNFVYISESKAAELARSKVVPGDIVIVAVGVGVGDSTVIPKNAMVSVLSQNLNKFKVDKKIVLSEFISFCLRTERILLQLNSFTTDTARQFLSLTNLKEIIFPIPPIKEQEEIVSRVESLFAKAITIEEKYNTLKEQIDCMPQAILAKAFKGELVEQLDTDGDARELLEEIQKLKAETGGKRKLKKG
ncbi:MAG: restriction endonuclease subunit S [Reichenbachiella sp.]